MTFSSVGGGADLEVEVLERALQSAEGVLGHGQVVVGQFERGETQRSEGVVGHVADAVAGQVDQRQLAHRSQRL